MHRILRCYGDANHTKVLRMEYYALCQTRTKVSEKSTASILGVEE